MNDFCQEVLSKVLETIETGSRPKGGVSKESGEIPSLGGENIRRDGKVLLQEPRKITTEFFESMTKGHLQDKDVLINKDGANTGKVGLYKQSNFEKAAINEHLFILRPNKNVVTNEYLFYFLLSSYGQSQLKNLITGSAQPGLNSNFINNFVVKFPAVVEQRKITAILSSIDIVMEKTEAIIEKTEEVKKGLMKQLLTKGIQHNKFKKTAIGIIPEEWEVATLKSIASRVTDGTHQSPKFTENGIPFLLVSNIVKGFINWDTEKFISNETYLELTKNRKVEKEDILYSAVGSYGVAVVVNTEREFSFQRHIAWIKPLNERVHSYYLAYVLNSNIGKKQADSVAVGNAQKTVTLDSLSKFLIPLPSLKEQKQIVDVLRSIDKKLEVESEKLLSLKMIKKGLLQSLLKGKVRVRVNEAEVTQV